MIKTEEPIWARVISILLHPLLMATYGVCLLFIFTDFSYLFYGQFFTLIIPISILSFAIPMSIIFMLKQLEIISDYDLKNRKERFYPIVFTLGAYMLMFYYFYRASFYVWFLGMLAAPIVLILILAIITMFWKISAHMAGIGCLIGSILSICYNIKGINPFELFIILFILAGILGVSRLVLKRHTPTQVYVGFLLGFAISYACIWVAANFTYFYILYMTNF